MKHKKEGLREKVKNGFLAGGAYIAESKHYIYFMVVLFLLSIILGFVMSSSLAGVFDPIIKKMIEATRDLELLPLMLIIFQNNALLAFFAIFFGILLGLFPVLNGITNGLVIGYVLEKVYSSTGLMYFWRLFPYGIFELPAIFISLGLGLKLGMFVFAKHKKDELLRRAECSFYAFLFYVVPLLLVAAVIEGLLINFLR